MKKFITAVAIAASMAPMAFAGQGRGHFRAGAEGIGRHAGAGKIFAQLNLAEEQKAQIKAIRDTDRQQNQELVKSFRAKAAEYRQLEQANDPTADAVKADLETLGTQLKAARQATHERILSVLTPEQRAQLPQLRAGARGFARGFAAGRRMGVLSQLNLTPDQKQQIKAIHEGERQQNQALRQNVRAKFAEFRELKKANDAKTDAVKADLDALRAQLRDARKSTHEKVLSVLTPDQRAQLEQFRGRH